MGDVHSCIAIDCPKKRVKKSGFCTAHKAEHEKSPWVKAWRKYQAECTRLKPDGHKKTVFVVPPKKEK